MVQLGEVRVTSAGNVMRLERVDGPWRHVRRIGIHGEPDRELWDADVVYRWHASQWEGQIPLRGGPTDGYPHYGVFCPGL